MARSANATSGLLVILFAASSVYSLVWDYKQQGADWTLTCKTGTRQSPIDIKPISTIPLSKDNGDILYLDFKDKNTHMTIENDGHTFKVYSSKPVDDPTRDSAWIAGKEYPALQWHIHTSAEHKLDGTRHELELHAVHKLKGKTDLLVVGLLFEAKANYGESQLLKDLMTALMANNLEFPSATGKKVTLSCADLGTTCLNIETLLPTQSSANKMVRYNGSLTTPTCDENVTWFVQANPILTNPVQLESFLAMLMNLNGARENYRMDVSAQNKNPNMIQVPVKYQSSAMGRFGGATALLLAAAASLAV